MTFLALISLSLAMIYGNELRMIGLECEN